MSHNLEHQKVHTRMVKEILKAVARANNHPYQSVFGWSMLSAGDADDFLDSQENEMNASPSIKYGAQ
ncbi:hypothetical protein BHF58_23430 [Escherichia coli]|nr:hypothetical protein [Escherichia coli]EEW0979481.1 hypothetical protein [Escherichia coli]EEY6025185.1 hypothetical protein [Escherichia coli]EFB3700362.1 hypothetical protein [Escherichia coli]EFB5153234.1 hypothetical protein [Escherichia coli]